MGVSYATYPKQPWEEIPDYIEFAERMASGDGISTKTVTGYGPTGQEDSSIVSGDSIDGTKIRFTYKGGTDGNRYKISIQIVTNLGAKLEEDFIFEVKAA